MLQPRYINAKELIENNYCTKQELQALCDKGKLTGYQPDPDRLFNEMQFLREDIERLFAPEEEKSSMVFGLPDMIRRMAQQGMSKGQIAQKLQDAGLSLAIIGALLHDRGMNKKGHFDSPKECSDFYQRAAKSMLAQEMP
ncbi:MAG: hypothetical protein IJU65_02950 [Desulfovibrio sp.]|nr:hypothetical protein [Desulfovibrio sp.]